MIPDKEIMLWDVFKQKILKYRLDFNDIYMYVYREMAVHFDIYNALAYSRQGMHTQ
jgi:hypothetical protein